MSNQTITGLSAAITPLVGTELVPLVQAGTKTNGSTPILTRGTHVTFTLTFFV